MSAIKLGLVCEGPNGGSLDIGHIYAIQHLIVDRKLLVVEYRDFSICTRVWFPKVTRDSRGECDVGAGPARHK